jgi:hypothetical protein
MSSLSTNLSTNNFPTNISLSITFRGPFLYVFPPVKGDDPNPVVDIYAPYCPYHEAGFFYSDYSYSETELWKEAQKRGNPPTHRKYTIDGDGITAYARNPDIIDPVYLPYPNDPLGGGPILQPGSGDTPSLRHHKMLFHLSVPRPRFIYPLYCDSVEVVKSYSTGPSGTSSQYGTALRFFYEWDTDSIITLTPPGLRPLSLTPPIVPELPSYGDIEIRYEGLGITDNNDPHSDSRSCFADLVTLAGLEWWLSYKDGLSTPSNPSNAHGPRPYSTHAHTGADCYAPSLVIGLK